MRIAVVSDIHSNLVALEAVIDRIGSVDAVWHLGDVVGYGPEPDAVVERLAALGAVGVRGNHDAAASGGTEIDWFNPDARAAMEWTRGAIAETTRAWLAALPVRRIESGFTLVHGSPRDPMWEYVTSAALARAALSAISTEHGLHGHTHVPIVFTEVDGRMRTLAPRAGNTVALGEGRMLLNPGSVGQPRDGDPRASYLVMDLDAGTATWGRAAYDFEAVGAAMRAAGLPARLADRLRVGACPSPVIGGRRPLQGRKPGDRRVRVERPHAPYFRYTGRGQLTAKEAASAPTSPTGRAFAAVRGFFFGRPLASEEELGERLSKTKALAIFSSDAISSSAYATEEILRVLILGGAAALAFGVEISIAISILLVAVAISYRQICVAYPTGGGSYTVSRRNIGRTVSLIAASALLIDYVMTVAVSTSSAVEQIVSAFPALYDERVFIGVGAIALIAVANLRGLREAGNIFAAPTYLFVGSALLMIAVGAYRIVVLGEGSTYGPTIADQLHDTVQPLTALLLLRAFAAGAVALTGTEAIATGVPAFKPPEAKNAATTLAVMAALLATLFIGITFLAVNFAIIPIEFPEKQTVIAQVARTVYGDGLAFYLFQAFTAVLLFLAANTSFNAFPRLLAILAGDGHMPRQFALRGDRLAFSYGIIVLASLAALLIIVFQGSTHLLIPLYAVGVFIDFTISQTGMIRHWLRERSPGWRRRLSINAFGAVLTGIVAVIVTTVKFWDGAWLVLVLIPTFVAIMWFIHRQYEQQELELLVRDDGVLPGPHREQRVIVPVNGINRAVVQAVNFGRALAPDIRAVYVTDDLEVADALRARWERQLPDVPLVIVESPYRAVISPVVAYLDILDQAWPPDKEAPLTIVVLPEYVARHWWDRLLYNQTAKRLKAALVGREHTVIADVPYRRGH